MGRLVRRSVGWWPWRSARKKTATVKFVNSFALNTKKVFFAIVNQTNIIFLNCHWSLSMNFGVIGFPFL